MTRYRLYGVDLATDRRFSHSVPEVPASQRPPDVSFEISRTGPPYAEGEAGAPPLYRSPERLADGTSVLTATATGAGTLLRYAGDATFLVSDRRISAWPEPGTEEERAAEEDRTGPIPPRIEVRLLGPVLAFWLESRGVAALHAASVTVGGGAVAFLATQGGGKSSLAAAMLAAGHPLLADDVTAVDVPVGKGGEVRARPAYPQMRFWPADAERWLGLGSSSGLPRAHPGFEKLRAPVGGAEGFGRFDPMPRPLARLYLPDRRPPGNRGGVAIEPVPPREALMALLAGSFLPRLVEAMGWGARRLDQVGRLAAAVPVRRLVLPHGLDRLGEAAEAVIRDAAPAATRG